MRRRSLTQLALFALLAALAGGGCGDYYPAAAGRMLLLTVEFSDASSGSAIELVRVANVRVAHVFQRGLAPTDRWRDLYVEARGAEGNILVARTLDSPRGAHRRVVIPLSLRDGRPVSVELFSLDHHANSTRGLLKRSLGRVLLPRDLGPPATLATRRTPPYSAE